MRKIILIVLLITLLPVSIGASTPIKRGITDFCSPFSWETPVSCGGWYENPVGQVASAEASRLGWCSDLGTICNRVANASATSFCTFPTWSSAGAWAGTVLTVSVTVWDYNNQVLAHGYLQADTSTGEIINQNWWTVPRAGCYFQTAVAVINGYID